MVIHSQGDLESRYEIILKPIRDLTKNWDVDLASQLEQYLEELETITISFDGGQTTMNFAEAALVIQGSTSVYSKKVEYLYALVHQVLDHLASKKKTKGNPVDGEEAEEEMNGAFKDEEKFLTLDDTKSHHNIDYKRNEGQQLVPDTPMSVIPMTEGVKGETPLVSRTGEVLGSRHDFKINTCHLQEFGIMNLDLAQMSLLEKSIFNKPSSTPISAILRPLNIQSDGLLVEGDNMDIQAGADQVDEGLQDMSMASDGGALPEMPDMDEDPLPPPQPQESDEQVSNNLRNRPTRANVAAMQKPRQQLEDLMSCLDPYSADYKERPFRRRKTYKIPESLLNATDGGKKRKRHKESTGTALKPISQFCREAYYSTAAHFPSNLLKVPDFPELERLYWLEFQRRKTKLRRDKKTLEDQGVYEEEEEEDNGALPLNDDPADDDNDAQTDFHLPDSGPDLVHILHHQEATECEINAFNNDMEELPIVGSYEELVRHHVEAFLAGAQEYVQITELGRRVAEWEDKIKPRLVQEEERKCFDIHSYGSTVLGTLQEELPENMKTQEQLDGSEPVPFRKVVQGKEPYEVCRLFLSALLLANNYNVEIGSDGILEQGMDTMNLKLLSTKRHHEELGDYLAPSLQ